MIAYWFQSLRFLDSVHFDLRVNNFSFYTRVFLFWNCSIKSSQSSKTRHLEGLKPNLSLLNIGLEKKLKFLFEKKDKNEQVAFSIFWNNCFWNLKWISYQSILWNFSLFFSRKKRVESKKARLFGQKTFFTFFDSR